MEQSEAPPVSAPEERVSEKPESLKEEEAPEMTEEERE